VREKRLILFRALPQIVSVTIAVMAVMDEVLAPALKPADQARIGSLVMKAMATSIRLAATRPSTSAERCTRMEGWSSGQGRVYQAGRDLAVHGPALPVLRPVEQVATPPRTVNLLVVVDHSRQPHCGAVRAGRAGHHLEPEPAAPLPLEVLARGRAVGRPRTRDGCWCWTTSPIPPMRSPEQEQRNIELAGRARAVVPLHRRVAR
jgi:hypothetical protein